MKITTIAFSAASVLFISLIIIGTFETGIVSALTATTTDPTSPHLATNNHHHRHLRFPPTTITPIPA